MPAKAPNGDAYQHIGGVPYVYGVGQTEITAGQYVTFLNKVDPNGQNPVQPYTGVTLWVNAFSPVLNPFSGEINLVNNATPGTHYQLAASYWANKPLVNGNIFDFAYFVNSLYNGSTVAVNNGQARSPLGFPVRLQTRYVNLSTNISTGMYDLQDSSFPFFQRLNTSGYVIPSENEWVKAAYYSPRFTGNGTHYYYYPTVSNTPPTALTTGGSNPTVDGLGNVIESHLARGVAYSNYDQTVFWQPPYDPLTTGNGANVVNVGKDHTPSPWLTYDQGGNAVEYTDTVATPVAGTANPHDLPVFVKVHGGIANATTYQLWLTATGTSDPYGQDLGQTDTQGGARFGYVPGPTAHKPIGSSKRVSSSTLAKPLTSDGIVYRLDNLNTLDTLYTSNLTQAIILANDHSAYVSLGASFKQSNPGRLQVCLRLPGQRHPHAILHDRPERGRRGLGEPAIHQRGSRVHGASSQCRHHRFPTILQLGNRCVRLFRRRRGYPVLHVPRLHVRRLRLVGRLAGTPAKDPPQGRPCRPESTCVRFPCEPRRFPIHTRSELRIARTRIPVGSLSHPSDPCNPWSNSSRSDSGILCRPQCASALQGFYHPGNGFHRPRRGAQTR